MTIKVSYNVTDVYVSETVSATYINVSYEVPTDGSSVWGDITGTLSDQTDLQNALNAKVPYNGATANVNLGEFELKAGQMTLDITPTGTAAVGTTRWNDTIGSSETTLKGGSVILKNGVDLVARVVNKVSPNQTLTKAAYQAVRVSGAQGQRLAVALAQANNDNNSADTIGLVTETIATNQEGFIMTVGSLEGINTTGSLQGETWVDGDVIYLSPTTAGALTNVKPIAPQHIIVIGYVEYAHGVNGKLYVKVMNGWELGELHDVDTTGATAGQVLKYNGTIWTPSGDVGITSLNGLNATTQTFATGSSGTDFNISSATSTHTFNLPTASATNRGLLSSADWTTFNNKQNALTNPVTGTGTAGQVAYFTGSTTQAGSNNLFWDNTNARLGINTNAPYVPLQIGATPAASLQISTTALALTYNSPSATGNPLRQDFIIAGDTPTSRSIVIGTRTRGTITSPLAVLSGDVIFSLIGNAFDGTSTQASGVIQFEAESNASAGSAPQVINFITGSSGASRTTKMQLRSNGNLILQNGGTFTDSGQRLQVIGDTLLKGSGNTSATTALSVQNSDGSNILRVRNDGTTLLGNSGTGLLFGAMAKGDATSFNNSGEGILFSLRGVGDGTDISLRGSNVTATTGSATYIAVSRPFAPTSGTATYTSLLLNNQINQTGGANGITRGLYVNPTLTAAADWRSIEWSNNSGWGLYGAGTSNNYMAGSLGIGTTAASATNVSLMVTRQLDGSGPTAIFANGQIQSTTTIAAVYNQTQASVVNTTFTLPILRHFSATQGTIGASATVTTQVGFHVQSTLTGATNNYAFQGTIASGTNRWNLYMDGTADNYLAGSLGIGSTSLTGINLNIGKTITGATTAYGIIQQGTIQTDVTSAAYGFRNLLNTAASLSLSGYSHIRLGQSTIGAGTAITTHTGIEINDLTTGTNIYGISSGVSAGTNKWNAYFSGTANNYMAGSLGIGSTSLTGINLRVSKNITGATASFNVLVSGAVQSDVTSAYGFYNASSTAAASFTLNGYFHFFAEQGTFGVGSTVSSQYGFYVGASLIGATNNYGFFGNIAAATGRWNLYMAGTALNYFNGNTLMGSTTDSGEKLQVTGTAKITGATSISSSVAGNFSSLTLQNSSSATNARNILQFSNDAGSVGLIDGFSSTWTASGGGDDVANGFRFLSQGAGGLSLRASAAAATMRFYTGSTERMRLDANGNLCIGVTSGGDFLNIAASTTAKAQINLAAGTAPTTPNNGDIWFDGTDLKMRIGGVTKTFTLV